MWYGKTEDYGVGLSPENRHLDGTISNFVPIGKNVPKFDKPPDFKTVFDKKLLHDPKQHRVGFVTPIELGNPDSFLNKTRERYQKKELELQTVNKDGKEYLTLSKSTVDYLKQKDEHFVKSTISNQFHRDENYNGYMRRLGQGINDDGTQRMKRAYELYKSQYDETQKNFQSFVADFTRSLVELEKPLQYEYTDGEGNKKTVGVGMGNFYPAEIQDMVDSLFGNVTGDDFIPAVNEERYNQKIETTCCLLLCIEDKLYRQKDLPYKESKQYEKDTKEFEEYKKSDDYIPYTPPPPAIVIEPSNYQRYFNEVNRASKSPFSYMFDKLRPYLNEAVANNSWFAGYSIQGSEISFEFDLTK